MRKEKERNKDRNKKKEIIKYRKFRMKRERNARKYMRKNGEGDVVKRRCKRMKILETTRRNKRVHILKMEKHKQ